MVTELQDESKKDANRQARFVRQPLAFIQCALGSKDTYMYTIAKENRIRRFIVTTGQVKGSNISHVVYIVVP